MSHTVTCEICGETKQVCDTLYRLSNRKRCSLKCITIDRPYPFDKCNMKKDPDRDIWVKLDDL